MKPTPSANKIRDCVLSELKRASLLDSIEQLLRLLGESVPAFIVGGFVRDCVHSIIYDAPVISKDVDIVIVTTRLHEVLSGLEGRRDVTPLGGFRWWPPKASISVDLWQMQDTVWISNFKLSPTIDNFLAGVDLNVDRISIGLHDATVNDGGCLGAITSRIIDLDATVTVEQLRPAELARAVIAHLKTGYMLSDRVLSTLHIQSSEVLSPKVLERLRGDGYTIETIRKLKSFIQTL